MRKFFSPKIPILYKNKNLLFSPFYSSFAFKIERKKLLATSGIEPVISCFVAERFATEPL